MPRQPSAAARREQARVDALARMLTEATAAMQAAGSTVEVVELALRYCDLTKPTLPIGGGLALAGAARPYAEAIADAITTYPKEPRMTEQATESTAPSLTGLAAANAASIAAVKARIAECVTERTRINEEVGQLRGTLVALEAAHRHFVKLGAQLALPIGGSTDDAPPDDAAGDGDTPVE